jgi:hypothetical protein
MKLVLKVNFFASFPLEAPIIYFFPLFKGAGWKKRLNHFTVR